MQKVYKSKIGAELVLPLILTFGTVLFLILSETPHWFGILILLPTIVFILHLFLNTNYTFNGERLTIKCGFVFNKTIDIKSIKKISETNNPRSSPATSLDRLKIQYGNFNSIIISPELKTEFINDIKLINSNVEVELKK